MREGGREYEGSTMCRRRRCLLENNEVPCNGIVVTIRHSDQDDGTMAGEDAWDHIGQN